MTLNTNASAASDVADDDDYSYIVLEPYTLDVEWGEYTDYLYLSIHAEDGLWLDVRRDYGRNDHLTFDLLDKREYQLCLAVGPLVLSVPRLEEFFGPSDAGPLISQIIGGVSITIEEDYNGNYRHVGELTDAAHDALNELRDRVQALDPRSELRDEDFAVWTDED